MIYNVSDDKRRLSNEIVKAGLTEKFYKVELRESFSSLNMSILDGGIPIGSSGLYVIYANDECLYVGESMWCANQRIRRFFKELASCSHPQEKHAGAKRAKNSGYTIYSHTYRVKFISWQEIFKMQEIHCKESLDPLLTYELDEVVAHNLKSKFNSSTYPLYGYEGATLAAFMGI